LPVMPLLAIAAAYPLHAAENWSRNRRRLAVAIVLVAVASQLITFRTTFPDYLSYFNVLGGTRPERILVDSDLDWGQDLGRLDTFCRRKGIKQISLAYFGSADVHRFRDLEIIDLKPNQVAFGWVAISKTTRNLSLAAPGMLGNGKEYSWLDGHTPVTQVGSSIDVYFIPEAR
ncbi:MAG: hypothetical protein ACRD3Q_11310, partial [Terriglobales bacterium]